MEKYRGIWVLRSLRGGVDWITSTPWRYFTLIFLLSLSIRIYQLNRLTSTDPDILQPSGDREDQAIAISLYQTGEFANPYLIPTGPTAHLPPVYPLLLSLIYRIFGITNQAGYANAILIIVSAATLYGMLPWFSDQLGTGKAVGLLGGLIGALGGLETTFDAKFSGNGEYLSALALGLVMAAFLHRWRGQSVGWLGSLLLGLASGAAFHVQPAILPVVLSFIFFDMWWWKNTRRWVPVGMVVLGILLACIPWGVRNYSAFHAVFFIRSNLGLELRMGNNAAAFATFEEMDSLGRRYKHPRVNLVEAYKLLDIGEVEYMRQARSEALAWITSNPGQFLRLTALRITNLWVGKPYLLQYFPDVLKVTLLAFIGLCLALPRINIPQRAALLIPLLTFPLIYYIVAYMPRYRIPINWILYILIGVVIWMALGGLLGTGERKRTDLEV